MKESIQRSAFVVSTVAIWMAAAVPATSAQVPVPRAPEVTPAGPASGAPVATQLWATRGGVTTVSLDLEALAAVGMGIGGQDPNTVMMADTAACQLIIRGGSTLRFTVANGSLERIVGGRITNLGDVVLATPDGQFIFSNPVLSPVGGNPVSALWRAESRNSEAGLLLRRVKAGFDPVSRTLTIRCPDLRVSPALAQALGNPELADVSLGGVVVRAAAEWIGGAKPEIGPTPQPPRRSEAAGSLVAGCDMTFCQLYGHYMPSGARLGDVVGLSVATTSWNIGSNDCLWFPRPQEEHPFIVMNMYRLKDDRFEQIGMSHIKHGFYALGSHQCGGPACSFEPGHSQGNWLGQNCTDTYSAPLNAVQSGMGPKYEVNPWTGYWYNPGSHMDGSHTHDTIQHRIQVHDADLVAASNPGATFYSEGFYCMLDDINAMNSASWKE
ncbi:MAG: hypothetical protein ACYSU7_08495, partial [Planctomycetota bacterium]